MARKSEFEKLIEDVNGKHSKRVNAILLTQGDDPAKEGSDNEAFLVNYFKILEYAAPKLQRSEIVEEAKEQTITIEHSFREEKKK